MIFYFSGTGNSAYAADYLAYNLNVAVSDIASTKNEDVSSAIEASCQRGESIGFVFPVYSWGVPPIVCEFIRDIPERTIELLKGKNTPVWMVATCGDETGNTHVMFRKLLHSRGLKPAGAWSVIMPNTYVLLPGFDVDSSTVRDGKIKEAPARLDYISERIKQGRWEENLTVGSMPRLKTALVYPLFKRWGISPKKWRSGADCISCGACASACPVGNITMVNGRPEWGDNCLSCLGCYHACPTHSVNYGRITEKKRQYMPSEHPHFRPGK